MGDDLLFFNFFLLEESGGGVRAPRPLARSNRIESADCVIKT